MNAEEFDLDARLAQVEPKLLRTQEGRRVLTQVDPLLFAILYLPHHLRSPETGERITFSDLHLFLAEAAVDWAKPSRGPQEHRDIYVAPRGMGKSTWLFLILPLWAAAHGHVRFVAAFADSGTQAETHLQTFKHELDTNILLREDFPDLCEPATRPTGRTVADNRGMLQASNGFSFVSKGIDSSSLGLKIGADRPDLIILDDIEPDESNYSAYQMVKRLSTIRDAILPLNVFARVAVVGTVTMAGSLIHQAVRSVRGEGTPEPWLAEENFTVHHFQAIATRDDGSERSTWPDKWSLEFLDSIRHTRSFKKNYDNDPMGADGEYWTPDDFEYGSLEAVTRTILSIDPSVTTKTTSDPTGLAVVGYSADARKCQVEEAYAVRLTAAPLRAHVESLLRKHSRITGILIETNQGGDLWADVFKGIGVPVRSVHQSVKKEVRAAGALHHYQRGDVLHTKRLAQAEEQMVSFPRGPNDDIVDAVSSGIAHFLDRAPKRVLRAR